MIVYKGRLLKKSSNRKPKLVLSTLVTTWLSNIAFHLLPIWLQNLISIDSESCQTSFPSFFAPPSEVAVRFESEDSEQAPFSQAGRRFRPAAWHRIRFGTCCFVPMSYVYSETNDWSKDGAKLWARLWSATTSRQFHRKLENFILDEKKKVTHCSPKFTNH